MDKHIHRWTCVYIVCVYMCECFCVFVCMCVCARAYVGVYACVYICFYVSFSVDITSPNTLTWNRHTRSSHLYTHINTYTFFKRKQITSVIEQHHLMIIKLISFYPKILVLSQRNRPSDGLGSHSLSKGLTQRISLRVTTVDCSTNCWQSRLVSSQEQIKRTVVYSPLY